MTDFMMQMLLAAIGGLFALATIEGFDVAKGYVRRRRWEAAERFRRQQTEEEQFRRQQTEEQFCHEWQGELVPMDKALFDLGVEYHERCEAYDRTVCRGRGVDGVALPSSNQEYRLVASNAVKIRKAIIAKGLEKGYSSEQVIKAIQEAGRAK